VLFAAFTEKPEPSRLAEFTIKWEVLRSRLGACVTGASNWALLSLAAVAVYGYGEKTVTDERFLGI